MSFRSTDDRHQTLAWAGFEAFNLASQALAVAAGGLLATLEQLRAFLEQRRGHAAEVDRDPHSRVEDLLQVVNVLHMDMPWVRLASIHACENLLAEPRREWLEKPECKDWTREVAKVPDAAFKDANDSIFTQLRTIAESARAFPLEKETSRRLIHENNLVRAGVDIMDRFASTARRGLQEQLRLLAYDGRDEVMLALLKFDRVYRSFLAAFDFIAALIRPTSEKDSEKAEASNADLMKRVRSAAPEDPSDLNHGWNVFKYIRNQLEAIIPE
jgi:hypothetical protein